MRSSPAPNHHQRAHQLKQVAQQRSLNGGVGIEEIDQRKTELQAGDLAGKEQHLIQQREGQAVDQAHGQLAQQGGKADGHMGKGQRGHQRGQQKGHRPGKDRLDAHGESCGGEEGSKGHYSAHANQDQRHGAQKARPLRHLL